MVIIGHTFSFCRFGPLKKTPPQIVLLEKLCSLSRKGELHFVHFENGVKKALRRLFPF